MTILKARTLGKYGVITDVDPYDLPPEAFSFSVNFRFVNGKVERSPVFRRLAATTIISSTPRHIGTYFPNSGQDILFVGYKNGRATRIVSGGENSVEETSWVASDSEAAYTHCASGGVFYLNREDREPWGFRSTDTQFQKITGWDATWRCKALRSYNSALIALNVTKGGVQSPTMVKTSGFASANAFPTTWDEATPGTNATENPLVEMRGQLLDGHTLSSSFVLYSSAETWLMQADTSASLYSYRRLFGGADEPAGIINTNCVVEVLGQHYVFGTDDIWVHDGNTRRSIAQGRVRDFIFGGMNAKLSNRFFVTHNPNTKTVHFCYISGDRGVTFGDTTLSCNRSASYCYSDNTWGFDDLPYVSSADIGNYPATLTWDTVAATWETIGGTWQDQEDGFKRPLIFIGDSSTASTLTASLYAYDLFGAGSVSSAAVDMNANPTALLERDGLDLDEINADISGYKNILSIYPQGRLPDDSDPLEFQWASADYMGAAPSGFSAYQTYDNSTNYKLDYKNAGRFLFMRCRYQDFKNASLHGIDLDVEITGER